MKNWKIVGLSVLTLVIIIGLSFAFGWTDVFYTKTVGKAKKDAEREVFEQTQSYVEGKRQEALILYREYKKGDATDKAIIKKQVAHTFANFDETKLSPTLETFVYNCKYNP